jgi:imidazolonepropionase-like amidohydrolase
VPKRQLQNANSKMPIANWVGKRHMTLRLNLLATVAILSTSIAQPSFGQNTSEHLKPTVFAIRDAKVISEAGKVLPKAMVVIRDGLIDAVGSEIKPPADALIIDGKGLIIYPGFIDAMSNWGFDPGLRRSVAGSPSPVDFASEALAATKPDNRKGMTPEFQVATALRMEEEPADAWRKLGFTAHLITPDGGTIVGQSALVSLSGAVPREALLRSPVAMHLAFHTIPGNDYPRSLMGIIAHCRQTLLDADYNQRSWAAFEQQGRIGHRPPVDPSLDALVSMLARKIPVMFEADSKDEIHRALDFAEEFHLQPIIYGGRDAWKAVDRLKQQQVSVVLRLNFPDKPQARLGRRASGPFYERSPAAEGDKPVPTRVDEDVQRIAREELRNASILHQHGILFALSGQGLDKPEKFRENLSKVIKEGLPAEAALKALTQDAAKILGIDKQLGTIAPGRAAHLIAMDGDFHETKSQVKFVFADGVRFEYGPTTKPSEAKPTPDTKASSTPVASSDKKPAAPPGTKVDTQPAVELDSDRKPKIHTAGNVLIRGATVMTVAHGNLPQTDILILDGRISRIGQGLTAPAGVTTIDAQGMYVMPGIIDTHCHFAIAGGVNEFSLSIVPEVRVQDVIDGEDVQIYRALAGGVTTSRLLHGSANVIGGQDAVIKLKYSRPAKELLIRDAPRGVKFALGENVKRTDGRFPNSRLGVEAVLVRAFSEAQAYQQEWENYEKSQKGKNARPTPEPRRDLRLEALVDILKGKLLVHCHCYREDEILMLLQVADRFGFKVKSLQHVLEGYKIAAEIAAHDASCSTFSDWWAYKIEAFDAIPYNTALLHQAGASVCLKSDSNELMRHLYQEAAKCIKYGGMTETEALETITVNGAKQLGLEKRIGTIEVGKDGDLAIFTGHPLNSFSRPEMTLVEGEVYFQRSEKLAPLMSAATSPSAPGTNFVPIARSPSGSYVISGAVVHPAAGPDLLDATAIIDKGKISQILKGILVENARTSLDSNTAKGVVLNDQGKMFVLAVPADTTVVNAAGLHLFPGMIDAGTVLGLTELGSARETHDFAEGGDFQPDLRASIAINPDSELIPVTRANGVTTVVTRPVGSIVAGQSALINLAGWVPREMALIDPLALHVDFPPEAPIFTGNPTAPLIGRAIARKQREGKIRRLKLLFEQALAYDESRKQDPAKPLNPRLEALVPYAHGQKPVVLQAYRKQDIEEALKLTDELKLKVILSGATDAWKVASDLKKRDIPVIVGPIMTMPQEIYDPYDAPYACPARLHEAGVRFCIRSDGGSNTRNLPYEGAMAVSYGLPPEEGLKAVTLYPAEILGVAGQLGSIEPGKRANLVLANGDILQASTQVEAIFIDGKPLEPTSKQTRLYERYRERLHEVKEGRAPLGTK